MNRLVQLGSNKKYYISSELVVSVNYDYSENATRILLNTKRSPGITIEGDHVEDIVNAINNCK